VTPELLAELASAGMEGDEEIAEYAAFLAAADACLALMNPATPVLRVVIAADAPPSCAVGVNDPDAHPAAVELTQPIAWEDVAAFHIDEPDAAPDIAAALAGDDDAEARVADRDLLWYDPSERSHHWLVTSAR